MICLKCGFENPDGSNFCNCCGAEMNQQAIDEQQLTAQNPEETMEEQESAFQLNTEGIRPDKKRVSGGIILALVGVILVAAVLALILVPTCRAFFIRTFRSPEKLMYTVYCESVENAVDDVENVFDQESDGSVKTDTHLLLGDQVISLAASMLYSQPEDLQALSDIGISCASNQQQDLKMTLISLSLTDTEIVNAQLFADQNQGKHYIAFPGIQEQAILIDAGQAMDEDYKKMMAELSNIEIDEELLELLILRYMKVYFDAFESVDKSNKTLQLQGVSQKVTVLESVLTEKALYQVMSEICQMLKTDQDAKRFVESFTPAMGDNCYEDFLEALDSLIADIDSALEDTALENEYLFITYLDKRNSIVGYGLKYLEAENITEAISYIMVRSGRQIAQKMVFDDDLVIEGSGTYDNAYTAQYDIWYQGKAIADVNVENLAKNDHGITGKITFVPQKDMLSGVLSELGIDSTIAQTVNMMDISLELSFESNERTDSYRLSLMLGNTMLVGITHSVEPHQSETFTMPQDYVSLDNSEEMALWSETFQTEGLEKIVGKLDEAGLSKALMAIVALMMQ